MTWVIIKHRADYIKKLCNTLEGLKLIQEYLIPTIKDAERKKGERYAFFNYAFVKVSSAADLKRECETKRFPISFYIGNEIDEKDLDNMCGFIDDYNNERVEDGKFKVGDIVTVSRGSFKNYTGPIVVKGDKKCKIKLHILGRETEVEISYKDLL